MSSSKNKPTTGAECLLLAAAEEGVSVVFANPGTTEMWLVGALDRVNDIKPVLCLSETVATGAADGFGRMARRPAATILHLVRSKYPPRPQLMIHSISCVAKYYRGTAILYMPAYNSNIRLYIYACMPACPSSSDDDMARHQYKLQ